MVEPEFPPFRPHPWLRGAHAQTLATRLPRRALAGVRRATKRRFRVDATSEVIGHCRWRPERARAPLALLLHGLTGDAGADYMLGAAEKLALAGFSVVRMNMRGCGGTQSLARSIYHAGLTEDVARVARELHERDGVRRLYLVGFSLGGGMVLRWLGELADAAPDWLRGAAVVSPAIDLAASQRCLDGRRSCRLYREFFLSGLKEEMRERVRVHPGLFDLERLRGIRTLLEFDRVCTGPLSPYGTVERYYAEASALPLLDRVRRPTLVVTAQDDPFVPYESFCSPRLERSAWIRVLAPQRGGHVAFLGARAAQHGAWRDLDRHWAENRVAQFLHHLEQREFRA